MASKQMPLYCSFCGKEQGEVFMLIAGPTCFICDECVDLCANIVDDNFKAKMAQLNPEPIQLDLFVNIP